jgi:HD-GYP domain-containing protein (c-di-GMP phosphodiesterase class II)/HAMP domain-containing protein
MQTPPPTGQDTRHALRYPLHVQIGTVMILLVVATGAVIALFSYLQTTKVILEATDQQLARVRDEVAQGLTRQSHATQSVVRRLAHAPIAAASRLDERLAWTPALLQALQDNAHLDALYIGYDDGDFFLARPLGSEALRRQVEAPEGAAYLVDSVERDGESRVATRFYYDIDQRLLDRRRAADTAFDPRERPWYRAARDARGTLTYTAPYVFFTTREVGVTAAQTTAVGGGVVAADRTLGDLSRTLGAHSVSPSAELALYAEDGQALAYQEAARLVQTDAATGTSSPVRVDALGSPVLAQLATIQPREQDGLRLALDGRIWLAEQHTLLLEPGRHIYLAMAAPEDELLADAYHQRRLSLLLTLATLLAALPLAWAVSRMIANPLRRLAGEAHAIREFDFSRPIMTRSVVLEIDQLAGAMDAMKQTIRGFLEISAGLSAEQRFGRLLQRIVGESAGALEAAGGAVHLMREDGQALEPACLRIGDEDAGVEALAPQPLDAAPPETVPAAAARTGATQAATVSGADDLATQLGAPGLGPRLGGAARNAVAVPLRNRQGEVVGVLSLWTTHAQVSPERLAFVEALAGVAAAAIENQRLLKAQKDLLDAFIKLIAGAIDAKSPYTGGHCQRVPALTRMLAEAACAATDGPFADFALDEAQWEELEIASWLHDCGKVTTPEFIVDKATKLETVHDRIHEVRMRFEVLKRDAEIDHWKALTAGGDPDALRVGLEDAWARLDEEFAFVASCNLGGEFMDAKNVARLEAIAARTWRRTLDDRLGISREERQRRERAPAPPLPVAEPLLADRPEHLFEWGPGERMPEDNRWGFRLDVPALKYHRGELHNLTVGRGTLTAEDRHKINDHIVQTILMLDRLPFPKGLKCVPEIAGGHHEKMDGTGYPRRLTAAQQSVPARMMAIADIFEALTARDRPYKPGKTLSQALGIMAKMRDEAHIDPELFALFLRSGVPERYAAQYLPPAQIDAVDVERYLQRPA